MGVEFGSWLREIRRERGLRQGDLAAEGLSVSYISMLEKGSREPTAKALAVLASRLKLEVGGLARWLPRHEMSNRDRLRLAAAEFDLSSGDAERSLLEFTALVEIVGVSAKWGRARALEALGDLEAAVVAFEAVVSCAAEERDLLMGARALIALTRCHVEMGDNLSALRSGIKGRDLLMQGGLKGTDEYAQILSGVLGCYYDLGDIVSADNILRELLPLVDSGGSWKARASAYWNAAGVAELSGNLAQAVEYSTRALALLSEGDDERAWARCAQACAWFLLRLPNAACELERVDLLLSEAAIKLKRSGTGIDLAYLETEQAQSALLHGNALEAIRLAELALARLGSNARSETPDTLLVLTEAQLAVNDQQAARGTADLLEMTLLSLPHSRTAAIAWRGLAEMYRRLGNHDSAYRALEHALNAHAIYVVDRDSTLNSQL